jgi:hypothetical protein
MKIQTTLPRGGLLLCLISFLTCASPVLGVATVDQIVTLRPGWNAIWLEVDPTNTAPAAVFAGANIASVWGWSTRPSFAGFIADSTEPSWNQDQMLMFVPATLPESFQNNLFAIRARRPYLVKLLGASTATVTVTGAPAAGRQDWVPNTFNLRGFPIDSATAPTFLNFFRNSPAHFHSDQLEAIYELNAAGTWVLVAPGDLMKSGVAYWVKCQGASSYVAPFEASVSANGSLDFELNETELTLKFLNRRPTATQLSVNGLAVGTGAFSVVSVSTEAGLVFTPITGPWPVTVDANSAYSAPVRIARGKLPSNSFAGIVTITDGQGSKFWIPLAAERVNVSNEANTAAGEAKTRAGLWVGVVSVDAVSEAHSGPLTTVTVQDQGATHQEILRTAAGETPTPVPNPFRLRLLLHVDTNGVTRLLKEVIQMSSPGTITNDVDGFAVAATASRAVLVTDDAQLTKYAGSQLIGGKAVGRRFSTPDFDFASVPTNNFVEMSGFFAFNNAVRAQITLSPTLPTNPFRHKFHPDHDNLEDDYITTARNPEVYEVTRQIEMTPSATNPLGKTDPAYGDDTIGGTYLETVTGLHRAPVISSGKFLLKRLSRIGTLN